MENHGENTQFNDNNDYPAGEDRKAKYCYFFLREAIITLLRNPTKVKAIASVKSLAIDSKNPVVEYLSAVYFLDIKLSEMR